MTDIPEKQTIEYYDAYDLEIYLKKKYDITITDDFWTSHVFFHDICDNKIEYFDFHYAVNHPENCDPELAEVARILSEDLDEPDGIEVMYET